MSSQYHHLPDKEVEADIDLVTCSRSHSDVVEPGLQHRQSDPRSGAGTVLVTAAPVTVVLSLTVPGSPVVGSLCPGLTLLYRILQVLIPKD